ncbi:hypothetical protein PINS_up006229 [Pythium insidiosum]|nr:hypothetical protein PINS_up006229 [Pythium insidiosum]
MAAVSNGQAPASGAAEMQTPRDADGGGDASAVASLVTRLRLRTRRPPSTAVEPPPRDSDPRDDVAFALPAGRRTRPLSAQLSTVRRRHGLSALVHTLCRRFAGRLVVQGKLLNHEELLVRQIAWLPPHEKDVERDTDVIQLPSDAVMRFLVCCDDAPASLVGHERVSALVVSSTDPFQDDSAMPRIRASHAATLEPSTLGRIDAAWSSDHHQMLESMNQVFGFSVRSYLALGDDDNSGRSQDEDAEFSANERIERHSVFRDLRGVQQLMRRTGLDAMQWLSLVETPATDCKAWSHTTLAAAQKTRWSNDRVARGDELVRSGHKKQALVEFTGAIKLDDANTTAWSRRGRLHLELRQYEDAIRDLERVVQLNSADPEVLESLLRAKSKLSHSKHVVTSVTTMAPTAVPTIEAKRVAVESQRESIGKSRVETLEKDRLRRLLEQEEDARRRHKKRRRSSRRSRDSGSPSDSDSQSCDSESSRSHHRRKSKKSKKAKDKKRKKSSKSSRRRKERSDSDTESDSTERRQRRRDARSRSRSRSRSRGRRSRRSESVASSHHSNSVNGSKH